MLNFDNNTVRATEPTLNLFIICCDVQWPRKVSVQRWNAVRPGDFCVLLEWMASLICWFRGSSSLATVRARFYLFVCVKFVALVYFCAKERAGACVRAFAPCWFFKFNVGFDDHGDQEGRAVYLPRPALRLDLFWCFFVKKSEETLLSL